MSVQQDPMWKRPSTHRPRAYKAHGHWWADWKAPDGEYKVTVRNTQAAALAQANKFASEAGQ